MARPRICRRPLRQRHQPPPLTHPGPWADAAWDEAVLKAPRNWLRKASIGSGGAEGRGSRPSCQRKEAMCLNTDGAWALVEVATSRLDTGQVKGAEGSSSSCW